MSHKAPDVRQLLPEARSDSNWPPRVRALFLKMVIIYAHGIPSEQPIGRSENKGV